MRAFVRALVLLEIDAARRVAAAVRERVFRAGAVMSIAACTAARRLESFRVGTLVIGAYTLGRGCVVGAIDRVMRRFSSTATTYQFRGCLQQMATTKIDALRDRWLQRRNLFLLLDK